MSNQDPTERDESKATSAPDTQPTEGEVEGASASESAGADSKSAPEPSEVSPAGGEPAPSGSQPAEGASTEPAPEEGPADEGAAPEPAASEGSAEAGAGEDAAPEPSGSEGSAEAGAGEETTQGGKKKRRRRKKKGKKPEGEAAVQEKQEKPAGPFAAYFEGGERKHAFGAGEIVAGRVVRIEDGAAVIDLFGKALAVMDALEPAEITEIEPEPAETEVAQAGEGGAEPGATAEAEGAEASPAADEPSPAPGEAAAEVAEVATAAPEAASQAPAATAEEASSSPSEGRAAGEAVVEASTTGAVEPEASADVEEEEGGAYESSAGTTPAVVLPPEVEAYQVPALAEASPEIGSIFRGRVASVSESGHVAIVNRAIEKPMVKARLRALRGEKTPVSGLVFGFNRGGFDVLVDGVRCFCPASGFSLEPVDDPNEFVGKKLEFTLPPAKGSGRSLVVTRRALLERERRRITRERFKTLEVGQRFAARVVEVKDFGVVVDIGEGVEGLVHASELSWTRGVRPADVVERGATVDVEVIEVRPITRKDRHGKLSLSMRRCLPDPWSEHPGVVKEGHFQMAKVVRTTEFGAFCELAPGIDGLLHVSELGGREIKHAKQAVKVGDELGVIVDRVDPKQRRVSLSKLSPAETEKLQAGELEPGSVKRPPRQGDHITVVVERTEHHGVHVQIEGVIGKRGRGYISNRDLGSGEAKKSLVPGSKLDVKVVGVDRDGGLKCSIRAKEVDEERKAVKEYRRESSRQGFGTLADLLREKLGEKGDS